MPISLFAQFSPLLPPQSVSPNTSENTSFRLDLRTAAEFVPRLPSVENGEDRRRWEEMKGDGAPMDAVTAYSVLWRPIPAHWICAEASSLV